MLVLVVMQTVNLVFKKFSSSSFLHLECYNDHFLSFKKKKKTLGIFHLPVLNFGIWPIDFCSFVAYVLMMEVLFCVLFWQSMLLEMRCQVHSELAVIEEEEGCLEASLTHLQKAMLLDNGSLRERLSSAFRLLQLRGTLYQTPPRTEDKAAMLMQQVFSPSVSDSITLQNVKSLWRWTRQDFSAYTVIVMHGFCVFKSNQFSS